MVGLRDHILSRQCEISLDWFTDTANILPDDQVKNYRINTAAGADLTKSVGPSAEFLQMPIAFNYRYVEAWSHSAFADSSLDSNKTPTSSTPIKAPSTYREAWRTMHILSLNPPTNTFPLDLDLDCFRREISRLICSH